jgi:hypothetical protein
VAFECPAPTYISIVPSTWGSATSHSGVTNQIEPHQPLTLKFYFSKYLNLKSGFIL